MPQKSIPADVERYVEETRESSPAYFPGKSGRPLMMRRDYGSESHGFKMASEHELNDLHLEVNPRLGSCILRGNGDMLEVARVLTRFMLPKLLGVGGRAIPKPPGKYRGFDFHWSNAQAAWDVITATPNMDVDGATFVLWCPLDGSSLSPLGRPWSLKEMQYVAKYLGQHPGYANSYEGSTYRRMAQRVAANYRAMSRYGADCHIAQFGLDDLVRGGSATLYHGTTRSFQRFDAAHIRHDLIDRFYKAPGIFLTPRRGVAQQYAGATRNSLIPASVIDDLTRRNRGAGEVLGRLVREGREAWDGLFEDAKTAFPDAETPIEALERMTGGVDPNTLMDIAQHVEGSGYANAPEAETLFDLWGGVPKGPPAYVFDNMDAVGLDSSEYRPKVYTVSVSGLDRVLVTKSKPEAEKARSRGYDAVVFCGADLVDGVPEVVVFDPAKVRITKVEVID